VKNIRILPTDKPSRLYIGNNLNFVFGMIQTYIQSRNNDFTNQHIYITSNNDNDISDEGINHVAGSWVLNTIRNKVYKTSVNIISGDDIQKIILTTDQDLIKDGVQAIDDEFLEWFVKNPSCKSVEVEDYYNPTNMVYGINTRPYKIIIPQEDPISIESFDKEKSESITTMGQKLVRELQSVVKQTLEKIAENESEYLADWEDKVMYKKGFIEGANYQAERMYSEEDMKLSFEAGKKGYMRGSMLHQEYYFTWKNFKQWFEQFKKR
jgi:hypothetical protein